MQPDFKLLAKQLTGSLHCSEYYRRMYATDASVYRQLPLCVCYPANEKDIQKILIFANEHHLPVIPRAAGTSLAGQVVGEGIVVDISKHFTRIQQLDLEQKTVRVQAGVVRNQLNRYLHAYGLFFSPETSTADRCMIGGMLGNNSCGLHSLKYGDTRRYVLSVKGFLADGSEVLFKPLTKEQFREKMKGDKLENRLYRQLYSLLSNPDIQSLIENNYPHKDILRRNSGYALDALLHTTIFDKGEEKFNFAKLIAGSEGTLAFITELTLQLSPLPPAHKALLLTHHSSLWDAFEANTGLLRFPVSAIELMDDKIIELAKKNEHIRRNMDFIKGNPKAVLMAEFNAPEIAELEATMEQAKKELSKQGLAMDFSVLWDADVGKAWDVRRAGLGVLSNAPGRRKPLAVIEDMAVRPQDLTPFIREINGLLQKYGLSCVYYGHIATGELHLRPLLDLKDAGDREIFYALGKEAALCAGRYKGSLSGEHGDGRLRAEFLEDIFGKKLVDVFRQLKMQWDEKGILNPHKIVFPEKMNSFLRYEANPDEPSLKTYFDFSREGGYLQAVEKCNGSGDCRKPATLAKLMCPSYQATLDEENSTRARANILREYLSKKPALLDFSQAEIGNVLDLCLSCKGCKSECPSAVDMTKLKAEALQQSYEQIGAIPLRTKMIAYVDNVNRLTAIIPGLYNYFISASWSARQIKRILGFAQERNLPFLSRRRFYNEARKIVAQPQQFHSEVYFFVDEFTRFYDVEIGLKAVALLHHLGYRIRFPKHKPSGRTFLSKGMLKKASSLIEKNIRLLSGKISGNTPLIGIEPSTILAFRDEYIDLSRGEQKKLAKEMSKHVFLLDEFLAKEMKSGKIKRKSFSREAKQILLHTHCHQKVLSDPADTRYILSFPENYEVREIASGCCGMAGSFGFEKEHYELSLKIGELKVFPAVREASRETLIAAPGTSCRHQIKEGTQRRSMHPAEILWEALLK